LDRRVITFQWLQLLVLSAVHFLVDMFSNMLPSILPAMRQEFRLSLSLAGFVLVVLVMTGNGAQLVTGHLRADKTKPLFMHLGLILAASICLLGALPRAGGFSAMVALAVVSGFGIAVAHPEGLRAVHSLALIPPAISTAVFMAGGFVGFACGGIISTVLVSRFGLQGLYWLAACPVAIVLMVGLLKVRLAVEPKSNRPDRTSSAQNPVSFWSIIAMAIPAAISTTILVSLLPTRLNELGFELTFGGFSATMFGLGGALGSFVWAGIAHRKGELPSSIAALSLVPAFLLAYLLLIERRPAVWLLFGGGFCSIAAYILMITLARRATGPTLGLRMAFMVGGTWALANIVFMAALPIAERFGTHVVLKLVPLGYLFSGLLGLQVMLRARQARQCEISPA